MRTIKNYSFESFRGKLFASDKQNCEKTKQRQKEREIEIQMQLNEINLKSKQKKRKNQINK